MLLQACRCTATPFGSDITMTLIDARPDGTPRRLGTYGVISGATAFLAIATGPSVSSELAAGYAGERTVLKCTEAGLGTCWLGGTFRHGQFAAQARTAPGQNVRLVIAIGRPAENMRLLERVSRSLAGSDRRKPFGELFGGAPSLLAPGSPLQRALEAVRIAPSSVNSQPWRATVTPDGAVTFSNAGRSALNDVDLGIACCHFDVACRALGLDYSLTGPGMRFEPRHDGSQAHF